MTVQKATTTVDVGVSVSGPGAGDLAARLMAALGGAQGLPSLENPGGQMTNAVLGELLSLTLDRLAAKEQQVEGLSTALARANEGNTIDAPAVVRKLVAARLTPLSGDLRSTVPGYSTEYQTRTRSDASRFLKEVRELLPAGDPVRDIIDRGLTTAQGTTTYKAENWALGRTIDMVALIVKTPGQSGAAYAKGIVRDLAAAPYGDLKTTRGLDDDYSARIRSDTRTFLEAHRLMPADSPGKGILKRGLDEAYPLTGMADRHALARCIDTLRTVLDF